MNIKFTRNNLIFRSHICASVNEPKINKYMTKSC